MVNQSLWDHIDVALPALNYADTETSGQGKGSTTWAAHSHTPIGVRFWGNFDALVAAEAQRPPNRQVLDIAFSTKLDELFLKVVRKEEDVTNRLEKVLDEFCDPSNRDLSGGVEFCQSNQHILANPALIAESRNAGVWGTGPISDFFFPKKGEKAAQRRGVAAAAQTLYLFPFETKPWWNFRFLQVAASHQIIIDEWEVPEDFTPEGMRDEDALPGTWSDEKKKVFHLVRQLYGQMASAQRRYGIMHTYERWYFCQRNVEGELLVSRSFTKDDTSPSVFQAIKTLIGFDDHFLGKSRLHVHYARKAKTKLAQDDGSDSKKARSAGYPPRPGNKKGSQAYADNLASTLYLWDCSLYDGTDTVQLLTTTKDDSVLVKLQRDARMAHVAKEMQHEADIYEALVGADLGDVISRFRGYSTHLGVAMSCVERELDDFDDIGLENLSDSLKESAVQCVMALSSAGVLHNDIDLRNIVQSRDDPTRAKIIDFGRATFSKDKVRLAKQVERVKILLKVEPP
jgi:hypothetical protein